MGKSELPNNEGAEKSMTKKANTKENQTIVKCSICDKEIKDGEGIYHPLYHSLNGHVYCSKECAEWYLSTK